MNKHEQKYCPRCKAVFECKVGSILLCQCTSITLNEEERDYLRKQFDDCLCANCMKDLKGEFHNKQLQTRINQLLRKADNKN